MSAQDFNDILLNHPFFLGIRRETVELLAGCASNARFRAGETIFRIGEEADSFYVIRAGRLTIEVEVAGGEPIVIQTLEAGDVLGWSWLFPPYLWSFDARAREDTRVLALDARCLRGKCEANPAMGYELMKRFSALVVGRLDATRVQLLDMFAEQNVQA